MGKVSPELRRQQHAESSLGPSAPPQTMWAHFSEHCSSVRDQREHSVAPASM